MSSKWLRPVDIGGGQGAMSPKKNLRKLCLKILLAQLNLTVFRKAGIEKAIFFYPCPPPTSSLAVYGPEMARYSSNI